LLLQHSNVDYRVGLLSSVLALNQGHRFHHLKWAGVGDVNFGLFTLVWDHLYRTHTSDAARRFTSDDFGIGKQPDYPATYTRQLLEPFRLHMCGPPSLRGGLSSSPSVSGGKPDPGTGSGWLGTVGGGVSRTVRSAPRVEGQGLASAPGTSARPR